MEGKHQMIWNTAVRRDDRTKQPRRTYGRTQIMTNGKQHRLECKIHADQSNAQSCCPEELDLVRFETRISDEGAEVKAQARPHTNGPSSMRCWRASMHRRKLKRHDARSTQLAALEDLLLPRCFDGWWFGSKAVNERREG